MEEEKESKEPSEKNKEPNQSSWKSIRKKLFIMTLGMAGLLMIGFFVWIISKP